MRNKNTFAMIILVALTLVAPLVQAADAPLHNPYTVLGVQLRGALIADEADGASAVSLGPVVFQEIVPCRLVSTLQADGYAAQWGAPSFAPNESRSYRTTGELVDGIWTDPCSKRVPVNAVAVAARIWSSDPKSDAVLWVTPGNETGPADNSKVVVRDNQQIVNEATFVLRHGMFTLTSQLSGADVQLDIIGYFLPDPWGKGDKGDKGDAGAVGPQGPKGDSGTQGLQGEKGEKGEKGDTGATGAQGLKGDTGEKGDKGDVGPAGAQGAKGDKGDTGAIGPQGAKGDKGDAGAQGLQGAKGDKGDKGDAGAQGLQGAKGDKGDKGDIGPAGAQGDKGDKGDTGAIGPQGAKGDKGDRGEQGPAGATGAQGPAGPMGPQGLQGLQGPVGPQGPAGPGPYVSSVNCIAQGEQSVTIQNPKVHADSAILVTVVGRSLGNIISVQAQGEGWLTVSGKPATCFRYIVFN
jgi:Collagen triple helix repeat (20 copies)